MPGLRAIVADPLAEESVHVLGVILIRTMLVFGLALAALGAWVSPAIAIVVPGLLMAGAAVRWLFRRPLINLAVVIAAFAAIADFKEGIQPVEVAYALYYVGFLAHWFWTRVLVHREDVFDRPESRVLALFLLGISLSAILTLLFRGNILLLIGEWMSLSYLLLYYPVREAVSRYRNGAAVVLGALFFLGVFVLVRNFIGYEKVLQSAEYAWQVARGRAVTNTAVLLVPTLLSLAYMVHQKFGARQIAAVVIFCLFLAGLVLTQSRGYWVAFALGAFLIMAVVDSAARMRLILAGVLSSAVLFAVGYLLLGDLFLLTVSGLLNRLLSIGTATTEDISLVNRWRESAVVWEKVLHNPVMGYGMGVPFRFYDIQFIPPKTEVKSFLHNGYLALWYKFGIWGLGMMLYFWGTMITRGVAAYRSSGRLIHRLSGLTGAGFLASLTLAAITSNPFNIDDPVFMFAVLSGLAAGAFDRTRAAPPPGIPPVLSGEPLPE